MSPDAPDRDDARDNPRAWMRDAVCAEIAGDLWFPERGEGGIDAAVAICRTCPVMEQCREAGQGERFGIWGGITANARTRTGKKTAA
ncbi:WhiB family transcriptional regulator [Ruania sp. N2-46]|uniref:WhiB family transcriptional regulator n=2 Tax=Occultella gossypii TaxID=2800820 RepID=A0ABS7SA84_9MICO|nr:WhiB family transcriptional regulator [Occultella gossypii]